MVLKKAWIGYTAYVVVFTAVMLWLRFPSGPLVRFLEAKAADSYPGLELVVNEVSLSPGLALVFGRVRVTSRGAEKPPLFVAADLSLRPQIRSLFGGDFACRFTVKAYGGGAEGRLAITRNSREALILVTLDLADVRMEEMEYLQLLAGGGVYGRISGKISYVLKQGSHPLEADGEADLKLAGFRWEHLALGKLVNLGGVLFDQVNVNASLDKGMLTFENTEWDGPEFKGTLSGVMALERALVRSKLDLKGDIRPSPAFLRSSEGASESMLVIQKRMREKREGKVSFTVSGTLADPLARLL